MARLHAKEGIVDGDMKKATKEAQAAVKAFEPVLAGYTAQLEAIPIPELEPVPVGEDGAEAKPTQGAEGESSAESKEGEAVEPEFTMSHKGVLEMAASEECNSIVFRVKSDTVTVDETALKTCQELAAVHGTVGWLTSEQQAALARPEIIESPVEDTVAVDAVAEDIPASDDSALTKRNDTPEQMALREDMTKIVEGAKESTREGIVEKAVELQDYLLANVMTELSECMVEIVRTRPEDPISFLADRLEAIGKERERVAEEKARKKFDELLLVAEGGELPPVEASASMDAGEAEAKIESTE